MWVMFHATQLATKISKHFFPVLLILRLAQNLLIARRYQLSIVAARNISVSVLFGLSQIGLMIQGSDVMYQ